MRCTTCGFDAPENARFCQNCGTEFNADSIYTDEKYSEYFSPVTESTEAPSIEPAKKAKTDKEGIVISARALISAIAVIAALLIFIYSYKSQVFAPSEESTLIITTTQPGNAQETSKPTKSPKTVADSTVTKFRVGQVWKGTIRISDYKGEKSSLQNGVLSVTAYIGKSKDNRTYFEVYDDDNPDGDPVLSMWVNLESKKLTPIIGYDDAWYFYIYLEDHEEDDFELKLVNESIYHEYKYKTKDHSCKITLSLAYDSYEKPSD